MQFAADSGIETDQGILVNHYLQTNDEDIYAAGDVCQGKDFSTGEYTVQAIQPTAVEHARVAASNMARGHHSEHVGNVNMNVLDTIGLVSASFGSWMGVDGGDSVELVNDEAFKYLNLQFDDDVLVGASSLGLTQHVGVLRGLIQSRTRLGEWKEKLREDPLRIMEAYLACAQGQSTAMT
jgi:NAD(P)H-nitrite reductase large subunit